MSELNYKDCLDLANRYAKAVSGCTKVQVGALIERDGKILSIGANRTYPDLCKYTGCLRVQKYGNNDKTHRAPDDCRALHAEIDAIARSEVDLKGATIFVTRYPCEACARAIISAGIKEVIYGRGQKISKITDSILSENGIVVVWVKDWSEQDASN